MATESIRLRALRTYVRSQLASVQFWYTHFGLWPDEDGNPIYQFDEVTWRLLSGAEPCGTRGPHGVLPAFGIDDFGSARGYLRAQGIANVFEEMLPGMNLLIFLDPDSTPIELVQWTDPRAWDIAERRELRTRRRQDAAPGQSLSLGSLQELTIYSHDITASVRFYRDVVGIPVGLSFYGHVHLALENLPLVLRSTNWRCKSPHSPHATEPIFEIDDLAALAHRLQSAGHMPHETEDGLSVLDPCGIRLHFRAD
ncbi:MAG: VOC family protein [Caldilineales bacterium]|nr:VOC family protein [Caldilineales bacterium]